MPPRRFNETEKWCPRCASWKLHEHFSANQKNPPSYLSKYCCKCSNEIVSQHYSCHPRTYTDEQKRKNSDRASRRNKLHPEERLKYKQSDYLREYRYGVTPERYAELYRIQNGKCAIASCTRPVEAIDHDHNTKTVRGLLCKRCNSAIGFMQDDPGRLRDAAMYLEASLG